MAGSRNEDGRHNRPRLSKDSLCLSDLPDAILLYILSFLPTKSVVATSLLSRRWRYVWATAPNLQLDESLFRERNEFMNFAERALLLRGGASLVSFSLSCSVLNDADRMNTSTWITSAVVCNVEQLSLKLWDGWYSTPSFLLPCCIFRCHALVKLDLAFSGGVFTVPSSMVCLPRLKHLRVKGVTFVYEKSAEKLLSHPLLEELTISACSWEENLTTNVNITSPKLQSLCIDECSYHSSQDHQVCFFVDNLKFFRYEGAFAAQYCICGSTMQLKEAQLLGRLPYPEVMNIQSKRYCKLVNCLSRVQNLTLWQYAADTLQQLVQHNQGLHTTIPVFECVTQLNLVGEDGAICEDSEWLKMIFNRCPHLEHLNITTALTGCIGILLSPFPSCFRTHLKKMIVDNYDPEDEDQDDVISCLLNNALFLEELVLEWAFFGLGSPSSFEVAILEHEFNRQLNRRPKVSRKCKISVILVFV